MSKFGPVSVKVHKIYCVTTMKQTASQLPILKKKKSHPEMSKMEPHLYKSNVPKVKDGSIAVFGSLGVVSRSAVTILS